MSNQIHTAVIKGPDLSHDETFFGEDGIKKVLDIFTVFANAQIEKAYADKTRIVGLRIAWNETLHEDRTICRMDFAIGWTTEKEPITSDAALARYGRRVDQALTEALSELAKQYEVQG